MCFHRVASRHLRLKLSLLFLSLLLLVMLIIFLVFNNFFANGKLANKMNQDSLPYVNDNHLQVQTVFKGTQQPTNMAFVGPDDILVLEKASGKVKRILNGSMLRQPY